MINAPERWAREIAENMYDRGLYPWHVKDELRVHPVPTYLLDKMERLVKIELEKLNKN